MREIKFRAKINDKGKAKYLSIWQYFDLRNLIDFPELQELVDWETLGQFTGLKDKNDKEIYEGDILKSEGKTKTQPLNFDREVHDPWWELSEVVFEGGQFCQIVRTQHNSYFGELPSPCRGIFRPEEYKEVIGNIYENVETDERSGAHNPWLGCGEDLRRDS